MRILFADNTTAFKSIASKITACFIALCVALTGVSFAHADSFDDQAAANGTGFTKVAESEQTAFLLFGSAAKNADGMQGRWKMLTKEQVESVKDNASAKAVFGEGALSLWKSNQNFSTTSDKVNLTFDLGIAGINIKNLATNLGITNGRINDKTQLTSVDQEGKAVRTSSHSLEKTKYYFSSLDDDGTPVTPLLKAADGVFSLRVGQETATETTAHQWKDNIKALQIDSVTTATAKPEVVLTVIDGTSEKDYTLSDVVYAGQYDAVFAYTTASGGQITANVRGTRLSDILAARSIKINSGDTLYALDANGKATKLTSTASKYFIAYEGTLHQEGEEDTALTSNSEFCLFGPGTAESKVRMNDLYSIKITRAPAPTPVVKNPPATKITKLTKPTKRSIKIRWAKRTGINGYILKMATKKYGTYKLIKTVKSAKTVTFTKKKLKKGKKYFFKIRTYKKVNGKTYYSKWSAIKYKKL